MKEQVQLQARRVARRTAVAYLVLAGLWILLSDRAVTGLTSDPDLIEVLSITKGWGFVVVTAALLYFGLFKQLFRGDTEAAARQRATEALREAEERQRLFIEHAPAALAMFDREMRYLAVSRRWLSDYQLVGQDVLGKSHYVVLPGIPEAWKQIYRRALAGEVIASKADPFRRANGTVQWLRWEVRPWMDSRGAVGGIVIFSEDITERIVAEGTLRESEERYRLLAENVGDVVWVLEVTEMRMLYVSPSVTRLRGLTVAEAMAEPVLDGLCPDSAAMVRETLPGRLAAFEAGDPAAVTQRHEVQQSHRDGSWVWVEIVTTLVRGPRGRVEAIGVSRSIDDRKRIEAELRGSEARFRIAVESAPVAMFVQAEGRFVYANEAALKLFGAASPDVLLGQPVLDRFHPMDRPGVLARIRMLNEGHQSVPLREEHILRLDGTVADAEVAAVPFRVEGKHGALVFAHDITEQKRAREQLRLHESVLKETGEIAKVGGWSFDPATGEGFWTEEVARIHDLDPQDKTSVARGLSFYRDESRARIEAAMKAAVEEAHSYDLELELFTAAGAHKWVRTIGHPVVENGRVVRVRGSFQDVTELYVATEALRESEARFRELAETINEAFWITDPAKTRMLYISPAYERIWGVTCASLYAAPDSWMASIHADDRERVAAAVRTKQLTGEYCETFRIVRPDGQVRWIQDSAFPVRDTAGTVLRIIGVAEDVTDKKRIETQFLRAQRLEAVGALAGGVAHDLNNILTPVLMAAGVLKGEAEQGRNLELISMIEQSARRGADVIRQLLTFSRGIEGERIVLQSRHIIREMAAIIRETFPREISLTVDAAKDLWPVEANSTQLHQVLMNLCVNARDAMPSGGRLTIEAQNLEVTTDGHHLATELKPGPYVVIGVADTGVGMTPETVARIFEPFFTTKAPGKGTGLGLSTVLGIVRSHGGHVGVYSESGRGSRFNVYLPARAGVELTPTAEHAAPASGHGELILVVDDESSIREASRHVLHKSGYRVLVARNGEEALSVALQHAGVLRLVLTDVMMPVMDGIALTRALQALDPGIAVVASSGLEQDEKRDALVALGVREILSKPCAPAELLGAVRRALDARGVSPSP